MIFVDKLYFVDASDKYRLKFTAAETKYDSLSYHNGINRILLIDNITEQLY